MTKKAEPQKKVKKEPGRTKKDLIEDIKKHKKSIQEVRFGLSGGVTKKSGGCKKLRKAIAVAATQLTTLNKKAPKDS